MKIYLQQLSGGYWREWLSFLVWLPVFIFLVIPAWQAHLNPEPAECSLEPTATYEQIVACIPEITQEPTP